MYLFFCQSRGGAGPPGPFPRSATAQIATRGRASSLLKRLRAASLNCLNKAIMIISVQILQYFSGVLMNGCITTWKMGVFISFEEAKVSTGQ